MTAKPPPTCADTASASRKPSRFADPLARVYDDPDHSAVEDRFLIVGRSFSDRLLLVVHAERGDSIRIISARRLTPQEREDYENDAQ
jgi:uncharacterized protein